MTAVTTNTRPQRFFFFGFKPAFWWTSINRYHGFSRVGPERTLSPFLEHSEEQVVLQYFATGSGTASCQDYEEYEFVECLSEKLKLSTYLQTVSNNHISFLNARSQLV